MHNRPLVKKLVGRASFDQNETVLEIGPGDGIITRELAARVHQVLAVELDSNLVKSLSLRLPHNVTLFAAEGQDFPLPSSKYHLFSNLPFAIEGQLVRRLLEAENPPLSAYVVVRRDLAWRWASQVHGQPGGSQFAVIYGCWFDLAVSYHFRSQDFRPKTKVAAVLLEIKQRSVPLLPLCRRAAYQKFIRQGFGGGRRLEQNLQAEFSRQQWHHLARQLNFSPQAKPTELTLWQWVGLFKEMR